MTLEKFKEALPEMKWEGTTGCIAILKKLDIDYKEGGDLNCKSFSCSSCIFKANREIHGLKLKEGEYKIDYYNGKYK